MSCRQLARFPANTLFFQDLPFRAVTRFFLLHGRSFQGVSRAEPGRFLPVGTCAADAHFVRRSRGAEAQIRAYFSPWPCRHGHRSPAAWPALWPARPLPALQPLKRGLLQVGETAFRPSESNCEGHLQTWIASGPQKGPCSRLKLYGGPKEIPPLVGSAGS